MAGHSHSHSHSHSHGGDEATAYFMDQLFAIAVCGAIAAVTIILWQSNLLGRMLHPKFHGIVLAGGIALLVLVTIRAVAVWLEAGERPIAPPPAPTQAHSHGHGEACGHDHGQVQTQAPSHGHAHAHAHAHSHAATPAADDHGHDHGWAPWRYIVLLLPVLLYFLALSNPIFDTEPTVISQPFSRDPLPYITTFIIIFRSILWEALPFIVLGAVIAGLVQEFLPQNLLERMIPKNPFLAVPISGMLGIIFPMCECGIIPIMRRLLGKGLPLSCCVAYLLAGPIVNIVVLMSTFAAFSGMENTYLAGLPTYQMGSWWMLGFRAGLGYLTAVLTGLLVEWQWRKHGPGLLTPIARPSALPTADANNNGRRTWWQRLSAVSEVALHDFVDITVFLILGALLSAGARMFLTPERIAELGSQHALMAILLMMGLAVALCLCSEADAFVAASFVTLQPSAKLAFLVLGPMLDFKLYAMYTRIFRPRLIFTIYVAVLTQVFAYSVATHYFWEAYKTQLVTPRPPESESKEDTEAIRHSAARLTAVMGMMGTAPTPLQAVTANALLALDPEERVMEMSFLRLENAAQDANLRAYYGGKTVTMSGRFSGSDRGFMLVRYKYNCCAADAVPLQAYLVPDDKSKAVPAQKYQGKWVKVVGRIEFAPDRKGGYTPLIVLPITEKVEWEKMITEIEQPANPFIY